jgi:arginyl-tRNA synthetase
MLKTKGMSLMNIIEKVKNEINLEINQALLRLKEKGSLSFNSVPDFALEVPREKSHGDFATNIAMLLTKEAKKNPREIANLLTEEMDSNKTQIESIQIAGPGFINFYLQEDWLQEVIPTVLEQVDKYGSSNFGQGRKVMIEFVSANPTGLLHMGNARGAALGDSLSKIMNFAGFEVKKEFYINDAGNQIENFGKSLEARYFQLLGRDFPFPEEGYHGEDIKDTVQRIYEEYGDSLEKDENRVQKLIDIALAEKLAAIKEDLKNFGVEYDNWYSEKSLHQSGMIQEAIEYLREKGLIYENEGALWLKTTEFGEEKDEVIQRSNGIPTYFAADIAYHKDKFQRGFDLLINIWGADHHGHVARMKGAMGAMGYDPENLQIIIMQLVRLFRGKDIVRMSKRTGKYITLNELVDEVGKDAARYFFSMRSPDSHLDFDLDLAKEESSDNPVYYVQYGHARICSIIKASGKSDFAVNLENIKLLNTEEEKALIRRIADFPEEVRLAAKNMEPHKLTNYAHDLASLFHSFYNNCKVIGSEADLMEARLALVYATKITLRNILVLLGVEAPERM